MKSKLNLSLKNTHQFAEDYQTHAKIAESNEPISYRRRTETLTIYINRKKILIVSAFTYLVIYI